MKLVFKTNKILHVKDITKEIDDEGEFKYIIDGVREIHAS